MIKGKGKCRFTAETSDKEKSENDAGIWKGFSSKYNDFRDAEI